MLKLVVFAEAKTEVIKKFKNNSKLKDKIYHLHTNEDWELRKEGLLYIDAEKNILPDMQGFYDKFPISNDMFSVPVNTHDYLYEKCECFVDYLPGERAVSYLKTLAKETKSMIGIGLEHERGDNLYDIYCWIFDYREHNTSDYEKGYKQLSEGVNFYPASRKDLLPPNEYIYACYESDTDGYDNLYLTGCPAEVKKKWKGASMEAFHKMNEAFGIKKFPYWVDLRKYELNDFKL